MVVVQMWDGVITQAVKGVMPTQAELDRVADAYTAANCGLRPNVRVLEQVTIPAYVNDPEPTCEDMQGSGWLTHREAVKRH
jgi:hypothetical protein